jgi:hypothetical protein
LAVTRPFVFCKPVLTDGIAEDFIAPC